MKASFKDGLSEMQSDLQHIATHSDNRFQAAERSCKAVQRHLENLKAFILDYTFRDMEEEIHFFKVIKPEYLKELVYFREVYYLEAARPLADTGTVREYFKTAMHRIQLSLERNHELYTYYRAGRTDRDSYYFTRGPKEGLLPEYEPDTDGRFSTPYSSRLAEIYAFERLHSYISAQVRDLEYTPAATDVSGLSQLSLPWTDKKTGLIEILYGIQSMGSLNNAQAELNQIARLFEAAFHIDLGNYSRAFQEIRYRKKGRTPFLDRMKEMLLKRMDEADEF